MPSMSIFWAAAIVIFLIVEAATVGLASIWFAAGSLFAMLAAMADLPLWLQVVVFFAVSIAALILTRPLARKYVNSRRRATNADRLIGSECMVTERIDNIAGTGEVSAAGKPWMARSSSGEIIEPGTLVSVTEITGAKLMVRPAPSPDKKEETENA